MVVRRILVMLLMPFVAAQTKHSDKSESEATIGSNARMTLKVASRNEDVVLAYTCRDAKRDRCAEEEWQRRCKEFLHSVYSLGLFLRTRSETPSDWPTKVQVHVFANDVCSSCISDKMNDYNFDDRVNISIHDFDGFLQTSGHAGSPFAQIQSRVDRAALGKIHVATHPMFSHYKRLMLMDADTLFADDVRKLWLLFNNFNATQKIGLAPEQAQYLESGWYMNRQNMKPCQKVHCAPFFNPYGLNSGVVLLSLDRIRASNMMEEMTIMAQKFHVEAFPLGDQDFYNAYGFEHPEQVFVLPCTWNVRTDSLCNISKRDPVQMFHGSRFKFHHSFQNPAAVAWSTLGETLWPSNASVAVALRQNVSKLLDAQATLSFKRPWPR